MNALLRLGRQLEAAALRLARQTERPTMHQPWCGYVVFGKACTCGWSAQRIVEHRSYQP